MSVRKTQLRVFVTSVVFLASGLLAAACSSTGTGTSTSSAAPSKAVSSIAAQVPASIRANGTLTVAADATYAPNEFIGSDGHTVVGMDADLAKALGQVMGLKVNVVNATFDTIIPGIVSGKYDLGMSSFTDTKARQQTVDFVTYFVAGTSFYVKSSGGPNITSLADLCGHKVAVEKGTTQQADAQAQAGKCKSAGKAAVSLEIFNDQNAVNLALSVGTGGCGHGRLAGGRIPGEAVRRHVQAVRPALRDRALRDRDAEEQRDGQAGAGRPEGPDREWYVQEDPRQVGRAGRRYHQPGDQRRDKLTGPG